MMDGIGLGRIKFFRGLSTKILGCGGLDFEKK